MKKNHLIQAESHGENRAGGGTRLVPVEMEPGRKGAALRTASSKPSRPHASFLSLLAGYIHEKREAINRDWMSTVRASADVPGANHITKEALQDHVPGLLKDLVKYLRPESGDSREATAGHSRSHGKAQWMAGYAVSDLTWEIYIIRQAVTRTALPDFARLHPEFGVEECVKAELLIQDFFQRLASHSITQFVAEQEKAMLAKNLALETSRETQERLTRTVSHELRNVLGGVAGWMEVLREARDEAERTDAIEGTAHMLADMREILNNLLDYSTLSARKAKREFDWHALPDLFTEIVSQWKPAVEKKGLRFTGVCDPALGRVQSDFLKLKQIAGNLISNAIKYRKQGAAGSVELTFSQGGKNTWKMTVADTGIGIAPEGIAGLFREFHRVEPRKAAVGTGLGLAICKEFAELLSGKIEVISKSGKGSRFEVTLPLNAVSAAH